MTYTTVPGATTLSEREAREVLLLQARETAPEGGSWSREDRAWATQQALAAVGGDAAPARFVAARAALAMQRLVARDESARRWVEHRGWHPAWVWVALLLGAAAGFGIDQLGDARRVNLLAPAVWGVVAWNIAVYGAAAWPGSGHGLLRRLLGPISGLGGRGDAAAASLWARHAAPLAAARAGLVLHAGAAALGAGLVVGLYLRGLVLDYRAGWQSTFLDAADVQAALGALLAPAALLTGIAVPDVAPLRLAPEGVATASAAPWIHLYAATLALAVVVPRLGLAIAAGLRARRLARHFPLPLDDPYFESLHSLMRGDRSPVVRVAWSAPDDLAPPRLFGVSLAGLDAPLTLLASDEGDRLELLPASMLTAAAAAAGEPPPWWRRWLGGADDADPDERWRRARARVDAVLVVARPGEPRPPWLAALARPVVALLDAAQAEPPALPLGRLAEGWLPDGRLLGALAQALEGDARIARLAAAWEARQAAELDRQARAMAVMLGAMAAERVELPDGGLLSRRTDAEAAQQQLTLRLERIWLEAAPTPGPADGGAPVVEPGAGAPQAQPVAAALRQRVGEGKAAMLGGAVTGALTGLKADLASGGLTLGAGLLAGGVVGALAAAGVARGVNVVRGTDRSFVACDDGALEPLVVASLQRALTTLHNASADETARAVAAAREQDLPAWRVLRAAWSGRSRRFDNAGEASQLADAMAAPLAECLLAAASQLLSGGPPHNPAP